MQFHGYLNGHAEKKTQQQLRFANNAINERNFQFAKQMSHKMKSEENQMIFFLLPDQQRLNEAGYALMCERVGAAGGTVKPSAYRARKSAACNM